VSWNNKTAGRKARATGMVLSNQPEATRVIWCDGKMMHVYQNLYDALLQLRRLPSSDGYWIDAGCINQSDLLEKNQQVQMMGHIYSCAKSVTI
jgi:hypothetical protein